MDKHSDLILDSKLNTRFESGFTVHSYRQVSHNSERRVVVQREEYWRQVQHIGSGAYGSVWLEECVQGHRDVEFRAIKKVSTRPLRSGRVIDYSQELKAVAKFSHDKVSTKSQLDWFYITFADIRSTPIVLSSHLVGTKAKTASLLQWNIFHTAIYNSTFQECHHSLRKPQAM